MKHILITTIAAVLLVGCASGYYTEYNDIKSQLLKTPNIDIMPNWEETKILHTKTFGLKSMLKEKAELQFLHLVVNLLRKLQK